MSNCSLLYVSEMKILVLVTHALKIWTVHLYCLDLN